MKKSIFMKAIFLLCTLLAGVVNAHADDCDYDYECEKVTDLSQVATNDVVLLVDKNKSLAISKFGTYDIRGVKIAIGEDNVIGNVTASMMWTIESQGNNSFKLKNDNEYLLGSMTTHSVSVSSTPTSGTTSDFSLDDYGTEGGKLYYQGYYDKAYFRWSINNAQSISIDMSTNDLFTLYKIKNVKKYVKWKRVDGSNVTLSGSDNKYNVVVIVDLKTGKAMSYDNGALKAGEVKLNDDKDRLLGDVDEKVQWKSPKVAASVNPNSLPIISFETNDGQKLYADTSEKGLKVGNDVDGELTGFSFSTENKSLSVTIGEDNYVVCFEDQIISKSWKLKKKDDYNGDGIAIFKKVEDEQKPVTIGLHENYAANLVDNDMILPLHATCTGAEVKDIKWSSSDTNIARVNYVEEYDDGIVYMSHNPGTIVVTAIVEETDCHDKASATCTVRIDQDDPTLVLPGSKRYPLSVAQAKELAENGHINYEYTTKNGQTETKRLDWEKGVNYFIRGKVSKVLSGMLAMFDGMDLGGSGGIGGNSSGIGGGTGTGGGSGIGGGSGTGSSMDLEDILGDVDMDSMGDTGVDLSSIIPGFGSSEGVTYYISDDATKDNQLKVVNGRGAMIGYNGSVEFEKAPDMSPGDDVLVCGPLEYTEDSSSFSSLFGGSGSDTEEPKRSAKVGELNYQSEFSPTLLVQDLSVYVDRSKDLNELYRIEKEIEGRMEEPTIKSADEEIAKWDATEKKLTGVKAGTVKITVKVKVVLEEKVEGDENSKDRSYTMKRKFILTVLGRDKDPEGKNLGKYVLVTSADELNGLLNPIQYPESADGIRMLIVGTRTKDDKTSNYVLASENSTMGGGKGAKTIENEKIQSDPNFKEGREYIESTDVPDGSQEILLIKEGDDWTFKVGTNEEGKDLYLYVAEKEESTTEGEGTTEGDDSESKFDFSALLEMFMPSTGLKVGTLEEAGDNYKAAIDFGDNGIATVTFHTKNADNDKNILMLTSSFDLEALMNSTKTNNETSDDGNTSGGSTTPGSGSSGSGSGTGSGSSYGSGSGIDLSSLDLFMASFNAKASADATGDSPKAYLPRIFAFQQADSYETTISDAGWKTIVSDYDVTPGEGVTAYIVTEVRFAGGKSLAILKKVDGLKGGQPYLLHATGGTYKMNKAANVEDPEGNLLQIGGSETSSETDKSIYVLSKQSKGVGFYKWVGGRLGAGVVYLPVTGSNPASAHEFCGFFEETTAIQTIEKASQIVGPYYDLQGRRVEKPTHGVYIVNGQKVVIK